MTLRQFIKSVGGPEMAAAQLGVRGSTLWRWANKKSRPRGNNAWRLLQLGVKVS